LSEKRAIELGSNQLGDVILFAIAEKRRMNCKEKEKEIFSILKHILYGFYNFKCYIFVTFFGKRFSRIFHVHFVYYYFVVILTVLDSLIWILNRQ
jgi:hypothetical protein